VHGELLQHLLIPHTLAKRNYNRIIGNLRDSVMNLREPLDEGAQRFPQVLLYDVEVGLVTRPRVGTLEVGHKLTTQLLLGDESPLR
jgi:hypothetical protein